MENLGILLRAVFELLRIKYNLWGYNISFWNILAFSVVTSIIAWAIWEIIDRS